MYPDAQVSLVFASIGALSAGVGSDGFPNVPEQSLIRNPVDGDVGPLRDFGPNAVRHGAGEPRAWCLKGTKLNAPLRIAAHCRTYRLSSNIVRWL